MILEEFNIDYFLISGTLLGLVRHNGFIPWDDDIDLIVDDTISLKINDISKKYENQVNFMFGKFIKICFKDVGEIVNCTNWSNKLLNTNEKYRWPFIDLFMFSKRNDKIIFFNKIWDISNFYPSVKCKFYDIDVVIPKNPEKFLVGNYGNDYMTKCVASTYNHRKEQLRTNKKDKLIMRLSDILKFTPKINQHA